MDIFAIEGIFVTFVIRERNFILDGVHEQVHNSNVVPSYNAFLDPHAQSYFRQPAIQVMMKKAAEKDVSLSLEIEKVYYISM